MTFHGVDSMYKGLFHRYECVKDSMYRFATLLQMLLCGIMKRTPFVSVKCVGDG